MTAEANTRADSVGHSPTAIVVQLLIDAAKLCARADRCAPRGRVHREALEVYHIDGDSVGGTRSAKTVISVYPGAGILSVGPILGGDIGSNGGGGKASKSE